MHRYLLLLCIGPLILLSARPDGTAIAWSKPRLLTWADFQGTPLRSSANAALSQVSILPHAEATGETIEYEVKAMFNPTQSWIKVDKKTSYLLKHEQGHFDIGELFARKMRKELVLHTFTQATFATDYKEITGKINTAFQKFTNDYDAETQHSLIKEKQEEWNARIAKEMKELEMYSTPHFNGKLK
jgi:predicted secreted Zn-dependent protease